MPSSDRVGLLEALGPRGRRQSADRPVTVPARADYRTSRLIIAGLDATERSWGHAQPQPSQGERLLVVS
jgi:hypothetical protein